MSLKFLCKFEYDRPHVVVATVKKETDNYYMLAERGVDVIGHSYMYQRVEKRGVAAFDTLAEALDWAELQLAKSRQKFIEENDRYLAQVAATRKKAEGERC